MKQLCYITFPEIEAFVKSDNVKIPLNCRQMALDSVQHLIQGADWPCFTLIFTTKTRDTTAQMHECSGFVCLQ